MAVVSSFHALFQCHVIVQCSAKNINFQLMYEILQRNWLHFSSEIMILTPSASSVHINSVCGKPQERVSPILVTLTSRSDSNFERSNISLKEKKQDDVNSNSNCFDYCVRKNEEKLLWLSADWNILHSLFSPHLILYCPEYIAFILLQIHLR